MNQYRLHKRGGVLTVKTVAVTPDPQVKVELEIPQDPFDDVKVNPEPLS
jgi:hypothetical protein